MERHIRYALARESGWVLTALLAFSLLVVAWGTLRQNRLLVESVEASALDAARLYAESLAEFRSLYTSEVVTRLLEVDAEVVHDYGVRPGTVPLPATLTILLGERIREDYGEPTVQLYSPYPFPWRLGTGGLRDDFAREAWSALADEGQEVFYRVEGTEAGEYLRYAMPDRLEPACVTCHNTHESTPRTGWQAGDVRGVLEIAYPLDQLRAVEATSRRSSLFLLATLFGLGALGIGVGMHTFGRRQELMDRRVERRTRALAVSESQIRSVVESIVEAVIVINERGEIKSANTAAETMFGYAKSELVGRNVSLLMPSPHREEHDGYLKNYLESGVPKIVGIGGRRLHGLRRDGSVFDLELAVSESSSGEERVFTGILRDISVQLEHERKLEELSARDGLTGLANRQAMDRALEREWRRCHRGGSPLAVALFDIDFFKQYNDRYGHLAGDECLKSVAGAMTDQLHRAGDVIARFGGEEFLLILPEADAAGAASVAEHIRQTVLNLRIPHQGFGLGGHVTVSAGVASRVPTDDDATDLVNAADMALYRAKEAGRNRVEVAS